LKVYAEYQFGGWVEVLKTAPLRASGGIMGGGTESIVIDEKACDIRNSKEDDINGALQSRASNNIQSNNVVRQQYAVRRLTPLECERLQGLPIIRSVLLLDFELKRIMVIKWFVNENLQENPKINVPSVVATCRKRLKSAGSAENDRSRNAVWFAAKNLLQNYLKTNKPVQKNAPINCEGNIQEKRNLEERLNDVCNAEKSLVAHHQKEIINFAQSNAPMNTEKGNTAHYGETEQRQTENQTISDGFGNMSLSEFGKEITQLVNDAESTITEVGRNFQYTIFDLTEIAQKRDLTKKILSYCVQNVTTMSILMPEQIAVLSLEDERYTLIDDKSCSDSARYKALGNGMSQPIPDYIVKRIVEECD